MPSVAVKAFAKLNLGLKIVGRRPDGFHELRTVYQTISLCDQVSVRLGSAGRSAKVTLAVQGLDVPVGRDNLVVQAAEAVCGELRLKKQVHIALQKRVPTGGGLGGGSSDAAAVLRALDQLSGGKMERSVLFQIAAKLGSDVPFFLFGGRAVGIGRGEEVYPLPDGRSAYCVLVLPSEGMNTAEAYRLLRAAPWPPQASAAQAGRKLTRPAPQPTIDSFSAGLLTEAGEKSTGIAPIANDFELLVFGRFPELSSVKRTLLRAGADWAALTGSGSAVFGLFPARQQALAAYRKLQGNNMRSFLCRTVRRTEFLAGLRVT